MIESEDSLRAGMGGMADGPVPAYYENSSEAQYEGEGEGEQDLEIGVGVGGSGAPSSSTSASTSRYSNSAWDPSSSTLDTGLEAEYDGYEELSLSLSSRIPPPRIDEDVSPPSPPPFPTSPLSPNYLEPDVNSEQHVGMVFPPPSFADVTSSAGELSAGSSGPTSGASSRNNTAPSSPCFLPTHHVAAALFDSSPLCDPTTLPLDRNHPREREEGGGDIEEGSEDTEIEPPPYFGLPSPPLRSLSPALQSPLAPHQHLHEEAGPEISPALEQGSVTGSINGPPPYTNLGEGMQMVGVTARGELLRLLD